MSRWPTTIDFARLIQPGDRVAWSHGSAEPVDAVVQLVEQRHLLPDAVEAFLTGVSYSGAMPPEASDRLRLTAVGGLGGLARLSVAGVLDVVPCRFSDLPRLIEAGTLRAT